MFFKSKFRADAMKHERKVETAGVINDDVMDVFRIGSEKRTNRELFYGPIRFVLTWLFLRRL